MNTKALLLLVSFLCCQPVFAGLFLEPEGVILAAISASRDDRLPIFTRCCDIPAIAAHAKHGMPPERVVELLKSLRASDLQFAEGAYPQTPGNVTVRILMPKRIDFDLVGSQQYNGILWRIVAIHP